MIDDLDEMELKLRALWAVTLRKSALADEDRAVAVKLLGAAGARRLAAMKRGERYRYRPQVIQKVEFHWSPAGGGRLEHNEAGWTIEATQNGVRRILGRLLESERCLLVVRELRKRGYRVSLVITEAMKAHGVTAEPVATISAPFAYHAPGKRLPSRRRAILEQLRSVRA